jgi:hypothetical protein
MIEFTKRQSELSLTMSQSGIDSAFENLPIMEAFDVCAEVHKIKLKFWLEDVIEEKRAWQRFRSEIDEMGFITMDTSEHGQFIDLHCEAEKACYDAIGVPKDRFEI